MKENEDVSKDAEGENDKEEHMTMGIKICIVFAWSRTNADISASVV